MVFLGKTEEKQSSPSEHVCWLGISPASLIHPGCAGTPVCEQGGRGTATFPLHAKENLHEFRNSLFCQCVQRNSVQS